jgi:CRP-like cAMP-binding protein
MPRPTPESTRLLKSIPVFRRLSREDLARLSRITRRLECRKGQTIFSKDSRGDAFFVVARGVVKIFSRSRTGRSKIFALLERSDFFGEMALIEAGERSAAAVAVTPASLLTIRRDDFHRLLLARPPIALALLKALCARLRSADREIELLSFNSVLGRLARILLDLARRHGRQTARGLEMKLDLSHQELADMAGTAREMVTRVLSKFARAGAVELAERRLVIKDPRMLRGWIF